MAESRYSGIRNGRPFFLSTIFFFFFFFENTPIYPPAYWFLTENEKWLSMQKVWISTSVDNPSYMAVASFVSFSQPPLLTTIFRQYCPSEIRDKYQNKPMTESFFFMVGRLQNNIISFFISNTFLYIKRLRIDLK